MNDPVSAPELPPPPPIDARFDEPRLISDCIGKLQSSGNSLKTWLAVAGGGVFLAAKFFAEIQHLMFNDGMWVVVGVLIAGAVVFGLFRLWRRAHPDTKPIWTVIAVDRGIARIQPGQESGLGIAWDRIASALLRGFPQESFVLLGLRDVEGNELAFGLPDRATAEAIALQLTARGIPLTRDRLA